MLATKADLIRPSSECLPPKLAARTFEKNPVPERCPVSFFFCPFPASGLFPIVCSAWPASSAIFDSAPRPPGRGEITGLDLHSHSEEAPYPSSSSCEIPGSYLLAPASFAVRTQIAGTLLLSIFPLDTGGDPPDTSFKNFPTRRFFSFSV